MKIVDNRSPPVQYTLDDASPGEVVRLDNGRLYFIGEASESGERFLINAETGLTHVIKGGRKTKCTTVDAVLRVA